MAENKEEYFELLKDIKNTLLVTRNKVVENVNNIGLKLLENNK